ncbi:hypothetical protein [Photorhabdus cinerea]|uniref:Iron-sulfur cluster assembly scaffold protein SufA n=1 Tax=Photorhabdus cinerea TaxID=471575 RepID=A0A7X5QFX0_9GAMM|nr:hypothetical protein [Photorhabdus cinerea]NHB93644.1 hypothetical protein [Photorhabdus cinerea]
MSNKITSMAAAMAIAMAPVPADSIGYHDAITSAKNTFILQQVNDSIVFLPIEEATAFVASMANRMRFNLKNLRSEWESKRIPIDDKSMSSFAKDNLHYLTKNIIICANFIKAAKVALTSVPETSTELRSMITRFGRASADLRYTLEEIIAFVKSTHVPNKVSSVGYDMDKNAVHELIRAEHTALGLEVPAFY